MAQYAALLMATNMALNINLLFTMSDSGLAANPLRPIEERYRTSKPWIRAFKNGTTTARFCISADCPRAEKLITSCASKIACASSPVSLRTLSYTAIRVAASEAREAVPVASHRAFNGLRANRPTAEGYLYLSSSLFIKSVILVGSPPKSNPVIRPAAASASAEVLPRRA